MKQNLLLRALAINLLLSGPVFAQSPGGVPVTAWYRSDATASLFSDAGSTNAANNTAVQQWNEYQGTGFNLIQASAGSRPIFSNTTLANFNPTVTFDGSNDWLQFNAGTGVNVIDRVNGTMYAAGYVNVLKRSGFMGFHSSMDYPGLHLWANTNQLLFFTGGPGYQGLTSATFAAQTFFSAGTGWQNGAGTNTNYAAATVSLNGGRVDYVASQLNNVNQSTGARNLRIGADDDYGSFSGQLNEIMVYEDRLSTAQLDQLETYMAIKYGTTYATGTKDYKNATGATVWTATAHASYKTNIAGIARDDNGALHQKQSWSTNAGNQVLISTTGLANTNAANATGLTNGQYLVWGDNGLAKYPTVNFTASGLSHRFAAVWQVQNTGSVGVVRVAWPQQGLNNLSLVQSTDATFATGNTITGMASNVATVNGITYNYADVTLANGQYFTFASKLAGPGGVTTGILMWHKADDGTAAAGQKNIWKDVSGNGRDVTQNNNATYQPALVTNASYTANSKDYSFNFNPFYYFDGTNDFFFRINDLYFPTTTSAGSVYGVMNNSSAGGWRTPYGWGDDDPNLNRLGDNYYLYRDNGSVVSAASGLTTKPAHIGSMLWRGSANGMYLNVDGQILSTTSANVGSVNSALNFAIGSEGYNLTGNGNELFQGGMSEVFAYSTDHQNSAGDEKLRINSYLALKYGITLKNDAGTRTSRYLSSTSAVIWDTTVNAGYNNSIAGIAKDDNSALHQKQSRSNVTGQQVLIGTPGLANTNAANGSGLNDGQFLLWGDNGLAKAPAVAVSGVPGVNYRFAAVWKVQNTGSVGNVRVTWPTGLTNITLLQGTDATFATVGSFASMVANTTTVNGIAYNYADVTLSNGNYFTFATQLNGPGGVSLDLRVWLRSDAGFAPDNWTDLSGSNNNYTQTNASRQPFLASTLYNFNPAADFGTSGADARFMVVPVGKPYTANGTNSTVFTASTSKQASGYSDIIGFGGTTTTANLTNANAPTVTKLGDNVIMYPYTTAPTFAATVLNRMYLDDISFTVGTAGIKYGKNGQLGTVNQTFAAGNADHANGSILGAQPEERNGLIGEVIAYQRDLTEAEKQRVRTYVGIKYGLTLKHNYIASNATTVFWDTTINTGYNNNIAGIARDDNGSLYQKQSWSINPGKHVLISTTGLANSNAANTSSLNDQQFLTWGDNNLAKGPGVNLTGVTGVNTRFAAIWKAQNTGSVGVIRIAWPKGLANLKVVQSGDAVIDASDMYTDMSGTENINGVDYAYADITLANGQYFTFAAFVRAPGGVTHGLSHWYRADKLVESAGEGTDVIMWTDFTSGVNSEQISTAALPKLKNGASDYFNYNPGINFTASTQKIGNITVQTLNSLNYGIFSVTKEGMTNGVYFNIGMNNTTFDGTNWDQPGLWGGGTVTRRTNTGAGNFFAGANPAFASNVSSIMYYNFSDIAFNKSLNGAPIPQNYTNALVGLVTGGHIFGSNAGSGSSGDDGGFVGHIGELVVYGNDTITAAERNKVNSYLAVKYGVTLHNSQNYTTSQNVVVWTAAANAAFYNNVAGVGTDYISALEQKQSRSQHTNTNGQVIMGLGKIDTTNVSNDASLADGKFLLWGDNGNTQAMTNTASTFRVFNYAGGTNNARRMNRVWKVQNTNVSDSMLIRFPVASVGTTTIPTGDACASYAIIFASDTGFTTNLTVMPLTVNGTDYDVMAAFPNGASYFTYAKMTPLNNGIIYLPPVTESTVQYTNNCGVGVWSHYYQTGNATQKMLGMSGFTTTEMNNFNVTITPEGVSYDDGSRITKVMARISTVINNNVTPLSTGKVRIYYSEAEKAATTVPGAQTNAWFKFKGDADSVMNDIYNDGVFDAGRAIQITPDATGVENGVAYVEFHNINSFSSFLYLSSTEIVNTVLPVSLYQFTVTKEKENAVLNWKVVSEQNNKGYYVQRSTDGQDWKEVGFVASQATNGNSTVALTYNYTDYSPVAAKNYYRLKQVDFNGSYAYSPVRMLDFTLRQQAEISIAPNPVRGLLNISGLNGRQKIVLSNTLGQIVFTAVTDNVSQHTLNMAAYPAGIYVISVFGNDGIMTSQKIVKE
ncbi:hypothetical protein DBR32_03265 [Taibaiella sp. KBW10]|uniref:T9SS type A sorting domain-containing protein n=1 Tax=Taibaiella sp. KBW10 TaxID=2153357 RepID=UPI000F5A6222|nr:T9SS type A sorting domain-containing protein [Taibaiella sp. KBW10]RQO32625.1 hypothetical protein DBR32_03265 [Taibaiella sp. KBW10]